MHLIKWSIVSQYYYFKMTEQAKTKALGSQWILPTSDTTAPLCGWFSRLHWSSLKPPPSLKPWMSTRCLWLKLNFMTGACRLCVLVLTSPTYPLTLGVYPGHAIPCIWPKRHHSIYLLMSFHWNSLFFPLSRLKFFYLKLRPDIACSSLIAWPLPAYLPSTKWDLLPFQSGSPYTLL